MCRQSSIYLREVNVEYNGDECYQCNIKQPIQLLYKIFISQMEIWNFPLSVGVGELIDAWII